MNRTLGQERAAYCLKQLAELDDKIRADFKPLSAGLPAMILQNGFGQTLAFLVAKAKDNQSGKHMTAFNIIVGWLVEQNLLEADRPAGMLFKISEMEQTKYLHGQKETLAMLEWLKRYANANLFEG